MEHRLSTVRGADNIIVLKGGAIADKDTHDELITTGSVMSAMISRSNTCHVP